MFIFFLVKLPKPQPAFVLWALKLVQVSAHIARCNIWICPLILFQLYEEELLGPTSRSIMRVEIPLFTIHSFVYT